MTKLITNRFSALLLVLAVLSLTVIGGDIVMQDGVLEFDKLKTTGCTVDGDGAVAFGASNSASGNLSLALGASCEASGDASVAGRTFTDATEVGAFAFGYGVEANGEYSTAFGRHCTTDANDSFAVGFATLPIGNSSEFTVSDELVTIVAELDVSDGSIVLPVKIDTAHPSSPSEGQMYVNTYDDGIYVYAGGSWRELASW